MWFSHQVSLNPASNYGPISAKQFDLHLGQSEPQISIQEITLKGTEKQRADNMHLTTTQTHPLQSAVNTARNPSVIVVIIVFVIKLNKISRGSCLLAHNTAITIYSSNLFTSVPDCCIQVCLQIMIPAVCVLSLEAFSFFSVALTLRY